MWWKTFHEIFIPFHPTSFIHCSQNVSKKKSKISFFSPFFFFVSETWNVYKFLLKIISQNETISFKLHQTTFSLPLSLGGLKESLEGFFQCRRRNDGKGISFLFFFLRCLYAFSMLIMYEQREWRRRRLWFITFKLPYSPSFFMIKKRRRKKYIFMWYAHACVLTAFR